MAKPKRKAKRATHALSVAELSALNRFVEHYGQTKAARIVGLSVSNGPT